MLGQRLGLSQRRACRLVGQHRSTHRHLPRAESAADPDAPLRAELRSFARAHARWGQRRALVHVRGAGFAVNRKKLQRRWREEGAAPCRMLRKRAIGQQSTCRTRPAPELPRLLGQSEPSKTQNWIAVCADPATRYRHRLSNLASTRSGVVDGGCVVALGSLVLVVKLVPDDLHGGVADLDVGLRLVQFVL